MKFKKKELKVATVTRTIIKAATDVLSRMNAQQQRVQNLIFDKMEALGYEEVSGIDWENPLKLISKYPDLAKDLIQITRETQNNTLQAADFTYELFAIAVDKTGWTEDEINEFNQTHAELFDYEEVQAFVNSFRRKLP